MLNNPVIAFECYKKISKYPDTPENQRLLAYLDSIQKYESIKIRNYDAIIKEVGAKDAVSYISSISEKKESTKSIEAYQFISKNIIPNVEYEKNNLTE